MSSKYTPKQIERYKRQKYISQLEKIGKNLFRLFRDKKTTSKRFSQKFKDLMEQLNSLDEVRLEGEYLNRAKEYYQELFKEVNNSDFNDDKFNSMRQEQMSNLNRIQKMKNQNSYKKSKHRQRDIKDGWE